MVYVCTCIRAFDRPRARANRAKSPTSSEHAILTNSTVRGSVQRNKTFSKVYRRHPGCIFPQTALIFEMGGRITSHVKYFN